MKRGAATFALAALAALGGGCGARIQSAIDPAGPQAGAIGSLFWLMTGISTAVVLAVTLVLLAALLRRASRVPAAPDANPKESPRVIRVVAAAVGVTVAILVAMVAASVSTGRAIASVDAKSGVAVKVTGHQWWWEVEYPDEAKPQNAVKLANEIHVPVGERVTLELESADVIHSFWAPNLHGKTDLIPGQVNRTTLRVDKEGAYRGQCAEYCGTQHAHMAFWVVAEPKEKFEAWLAAQRKPAPEPADATLAKGREVFLAAPCAMCHAIQGTPAHASVAPDLTHVASRRTLGAGTIPNTTGHLAGWVVDSHGIKPGNQMPPNPMDSDDLQALLAYLGSLK